MEEVLRQFDRWDAYLHGKEQQLQQQIAALESEYGAAVDGSGDVTSVMM